MKRPHLRRIAALGLAMAGALALFVVAFLAWPEAAPGPLGAWLERAGVTPHEEIVDGLRVRYVRRGSGSPVVLIHGLASSIYTWRDVIPVLAAQHDVLALDLPGFGGSDIPVDLTPTRYFSVIPALLDRLGIGRADFVGNSLGGAVALAVAARAPARVDRLVLIDAAGYNFALADRPWILRLAGAPGAGALLQRFHVPRRLVALGLHQVYFDDARVTDEQIDEYTVPLQRPGAAQAMHALLTTLDSGGFPELTATVRAPTLVLWGRQDRWIPLADADRFLADIPGSRKYVLDACGHVPQEEKSAEVAHLLLDFLARSSSAQ